MYVFTLVRKRGVICAVTPLLILPIQGVYWTFKHGMFRVGGSCNFSILCAHFLLLKMAQWFLKRKSNQEYVQFVKSLVVIGPVILKKFLKSR